MEVADRKPRLVQGLASSLFADEYFREIIFFTLYERGYKKKIIKHENYSGELKAGFDIPLKTVQIARSSKETWNKAVE